MEWYSKQQPLIPFAEAEAHWAGWKDGGKEGGREARTTEQAGGRASKPLRHSVHAVLGETRYSVIKRASSDIYHLNALLDNK